MTHAIQRRRDSIDASTQAVPISIIRVTKRNDARTETSLLESTRQIGTHRPQNIVLEIETALEIRSVTLSIASDTLPKECTYRDAFDEEHVQYHGERDAPEHHHAESPHKKRLSAGPLDDCHLRDRDIHYSCNHGYEDRISSPTSRSVVPKLG